MGATWAEWKERADRYTSGDQVMDILMDWKASDASLRQREKRLTELLKEYEWSAWTDFPYQQNLCPQCGESREHGHASNCKLAALLKEEKENDS